jgi:thiamine-phosphate pyrophosphorylase
MSDPRIARCRLYAFLDAAYARDRDPGELTRLLLAGGADILQVRAKGFARARLIEFGLPVVRAAAVHRAPVIVNDDIEAALELGADGVHLGQQDWAAIPRPDRTRRLAGLRILGISTHSLQQALQAERDGADYIGVGPVFPTATKPGRPPVGVALIREVARRVAIPFFAIGGITLDNIAAVIAAGAARVAVVSAILTAPDVRAAAAAFKHRLAVAPG